MKHRQSSDASKLVKIEPSVEHEYFELAMKHSSIAMALLATDGSWLKVNPSCCRLFDYTEEELLLTNFKAITHKDDLEADLPLVNQLLTGELDNYTLKKRFYCKKGKLIWGLLTVSISRFDDGRPRCFISQIQDITTQVKLEQKIEEMNEFTMHVAHEIKSPLSSMTQLQMYIKTHIINGNYDQAVTMLEAGMKTSEQLLTLSSDLLEYSALKRQVTVAPTPINFANILENTQARVHFLTNRYRLSITFNDELVKQAILPMTPVQLIFDNIVSNAIKYQDLTKSSSFLDIAVRQNDSAYI